MEEEEKDQKPKAQLIMIVGKHSYIVENVQKTLRGLGYECVTMLEEYEELMRRMLEYDYQLLLVVGNVEPHLRDDLVKATKEHKPNAAYLIHNGGPATIPAEVKEALSAS